MLKVVVIGAGNIAQAWDTPAGDAVLTHVKAFTRHPLCTVVGICDPDMEKARAAAARWGIPHHADSFAGLGDLRPDIVSICSPDHTHGDYLWECLSSAPKAVFCEKPVSLDPAVADAVVAAYDRAGVLLAVNYFRRWIPELAATVRAAVAGEFGGVRSARIKYYRGFVHNASHCIDLLAALLQPVVRGGVVLSQVCDYSENDPTITAVCTMTSAEREFSLMIEGYDGRDMAPLEIECVFDRAKILIEDLQESWLTTAWLQENRTYPGFYEFSDRTTVAVSVTSAMTAAVDNICNAIQAGEPLVSTGATAAATLRLCTQIKNFPSLYSTVLWQS